jgi:hypothetical protein
MMDIDSLSVRTFEVHRTHMMGKLGANSLIDLVKRAIALGLVDLPAKLSLLNDSIKAIRSPEKYHVEFV